MKEISLEVDGVGRCAGIHVTEDGFYSNHADSPFHPRQLVKLKKVKSVRVTKEKLAKAWDIGGSISSALGVYAENSSYFQKFCKELGL